MWNRRDGHVSSRRKQKNPKYISQILPDVAIAQDKPTALLPSGLYKLPVELLYETLLYSISPNFPISSRALQNTFASAPDSFKAQYLVQVALHSSSWSEIPRLNLALRFGICGLSVFKKYETIIHRITTPWDSPKIQLPKRLFRHLQAREVSSPIPPDDPYHLVHYLFQIPDHSPNADSPQRPNPSPGDGYPLIRSVYALHMPLITLLLKNGANPNLKFGLAIKVAAGKKNLTLVKLLVEGSKLRVTITPDILHEAVRFGARDVAEYFMHERGCVPDMRTLQLLSSDAIPV